MVLGRPTSVRKAVLIVVCCSLLVVLVVIIIRHDLPKELAMSALREVGPVFRGSCLPQGEVPSSNRSIGVVILNGKKDELYQLSKPNHELYCNLHGYPLIDGSGTFLESRGLHGNTLSFYSWVKMEFVCAMMKEHSHLDWLFWIDTDALFMNIHISLLQLLAGVKDSDLILIAADAEGINGGVFLIRNNQAGRDFQCKEVLGLKSKYFHDQQAYSALYNKAVRESGQECVVREKENLHLTSGVKACLDKSAPGFRILRLCAMGSWGGLEWKRGHGLYFEGVYMHEDFVIHFPGDRRVKADLMKQALSSRI